MTHTITEHAQKLDRVARVARDAGVQGILLAAHHNIAWLTSGRSNRVDASREAGTARLLVAADGRRFVLANAIELPRMLASSVSTRESPWNPAEIYLT